MAPGGDQRLDPALVHEVGAWFAEREALYRQAGAIGARAASAGGDPQSELLAGFGRDPGWGPNHAAVARLSAAFGRGDVEAIMASLSDDCVFESTSPPDGARVEGAEAVRAVWVSMFEQTRDARFEEEDLFVVGDRGVLAWRYSWTDPDGTPGHVRGVDVLRMRDGKVCEKRSYVKG